MRQSVQRHGRSRYAVVVLALFFAAAPNQLRAAETLSRDALVDRICGLIETHAARNGLEAAFFARLLWKESRFDPNAVSPKGAEGVAQFMPATAKLRGLDDAFDIERAIPASAAYLAELKDRFGNVGLAAAAYNAGEGRVTRWLASGGFLPLETETYVRDILGAPADSFVGRDHAGAIPPLSSDKPFGEACRALPVSGGAVVAMAAVPVQPWGIQVAGHFRRDVALRQWQRARQRHSALLADRAPVISRIRSARGRRGIYAVRIGAGSRPEADRICGRLRAAGQSCIVLRNR